MDQTPFKRWMTVEESADLGIFYDCHQSLLHRTEFLIDGLEAGNATFRMAGDRKLKEFPGKPECGTENWRSRYCNLFYGVQMFVPE